MHIFLSTVLILSIVLAGLTVVSRAAVLVDFQVAQPPPLPANAKQCTISVLERAFANSFGDPETVIYTPPTDCGPVGSWAGISLNLTVTSNGTQFDRLGIFTFKNVEIWRSSTPEPSVDGIIWTYIKDVTRYMPLFSSSGNFTFELDNLIETGLNGIYSSVVTATFFESSAVNPPAPKSDLIIPISTLASDSDDLASVQPAFSLNVTFPRNTVEAYAELYASGNGDEEFWYFNAVNEFLSDLPPGTTFGDGPFREVQLLVDSQLAGVVFPYATIFTGGINPAVWRPITSYAALDLPTYFIDLTPFVGTLSDGIAHNISINVVSAEVNQPINANWFVTGNIQVITDPSNKPTTGKITVYNVPPFATSQASASISGSDVNITLTASHKLSIEAEITSGSGQNTQVKWTQDLTYSNAQQYIDDTLIQNVQQTASGSFLSTHNGVTSLIDEFSYPLAINITFENTEFTTFQSTFDHSYERNILPSPFILGSTIHERQIANGFFTETSTGNFGNGTNNNTFNYVDTKGNTFTRQVNAAFDNITFDETGGSLAKGEHSTSSSFSEAPVRPMGQARLPGGKILDL